MLDRLIATINRGRRGFHKSPSRAERKYANTHGLPIEIWENIFEIAFAAQHRLMAVSRTCRLFRQLAVRMVYGQAVLIYEHVSFRTLVTSDPAGGSRIRHMLGQLSAKDGVLLTWGLSSEDPKNPHDPRYTGQLHPMSLFHIKELDLRRSWKEAWDTDKPIPSAVITRLTTLSNLRVLCLDYLPFDSTMVHLLSVVCQVEDLTLARISTPLEDISFPSAGLPMRKLRALRVFMTLNMPSAFLTAIVTSLAPPELELFALTSMRCVDNEDTTILGDVLAGLCDILKPNILKKLFVWPVLDLSQPGLVRLFSSQPSIERFAWFPLPLDGRNAVPTPCLLSPQSLPQVHTIECHASHLPWAPRQNIVKASIYCYDMPIIEALPLVFALPSRLTAICLHYLETFPLACLSNLATLFPNLERLSIISQAFTLTRDSSPPTALEVVLQLWQNASPLDSFPPFPSLSSALISTPPCRGFTRIPSPYNTLSAEWSTLAPLTWDHVSPSLERIGMFDLEWLRMERGDWKLYPRDNREEMRRDGRLKFPVYLQPDDIGFR